MCYGKQPMTSLLLAITGGGFMCLGFPGWGVVALTTALLMSVRRGRPTAGPGSVPSTAILPHEGLILAAVTVAAAAIRLTYLHEFPPPGITSDEYRYSWFATQVLRGERIWPPVDATEPLSVWAPAFGFWLFHPGLETARLVTATTGILSVPLLWWAVRSEFGPAVAVLAAAALAGMRWHVLASRLVQPYVFVPFVVILAMGTLWRALRSSGRGWWLLAGAAAGFAPYAYLPARIITLVAAGVVALHLLRSGRTSRWPAGPAVAAAACAVVLAPMLIHFVAEPEAFTFRAGFLMAPLRDDPVRNVARNTVGMLTAFFARGDGLLTTSYPFEPSAPVLGPVGLGLAVLGLPWLIGVERRGPASWHVLLGAGTAVIGAFAGLGWSGGAHRLATLCPAIAIMQALAIARSPTAAVREVRLGLVLLSFGGLCESGGFAFHSLRGVEEATVQAWTTVPEVELSEAVQARYGRGPVFLSPEAKASGIMCDIFLGVSRFRTGLALREPDSGLMRLLKAHGGALVILWQGRDHRDLIRECYPGSDEIVSRRSGLPPGAKGLTVLRDVPAGAMPVEDFVAVYGVLRRASYQARRGDVAGALARLDRLRARWPGIGTIPAVQAGLLVARGGAGAEAARRLAHEALRLSGSRSTLAMNLLGLAAMRGGNPADAVDWWQRSLAIDPYQEEITRNLAPLLR